MSQEIGDWVLLTNEEYASLMNRLEELESRAHTAQLKSLELKNRLDAQFRTLGKITDIVEQHAILLGVTVQHVVSEAQKAADA